MTRRGRIISLAVLVLALVWPGRDTPAQVRPPNVIVIVADDMGYADIGVYGSKDIPTPNIDALAATGIRFTDAYVSGPYCSPTRAGLMTGRYQQRFGHEFNIGPLEMHRDAGLPPDEKTIANRLRSAGYRTALLGKWHLGTAARFHPMERGFDEFYGFLEGDHSYLHPTDPPDTDNNPILDGRTPVAAMSYLTDVLADRAVEFITREKSHPFFLYLAFSAPHVPMEATDKYLARLTHIPDERRRTYAAMVSAMDDGIGRTLSALRAANLDRNTLIFFFSDNGGPIMVAGDNASSNTPLRGSKRQTWEGGIRVPFIISWNGRLKSGKTYSRPIIQLDILPTVLAAAGIRLDSPQTIDGVNLLPYLTGKALGRPHETLYWRLGGTMAIRKGDWKLVKMSDDGHMQDPAVLSDLSGAELYNLKDDVGETRNIAAVRPDKVKELAADWQRWNKDLQRPRWPSR
jgi:Arylsulfatase A and related enzymes